MAIEDPQPGGGGLVGLWENPIIYGWFYMGVEPKIVGRYPKMDGENNGKPYFSMDDWGGKPTIFGNIHIYIQTVVWPWDF